MLQGGVRDANETTDYTDATDVRLGSARGSRADFCGLAAATDAKQGPGFLLTTNTHEWLPRSYIALCARESFRNYVVNRPLSSSPRGRTTVAVSFQSQRSLSPTQLIQKLRGDSGVYSATMATRATDTL